MNTRPKASTDETQYYHRPLFVRLLNKLGIVLDWLGFSPANRTEESLMAAAARYSGYSDWGDDSFREGLRILLQSLRKDSRLHLMGWISIHHMLISHLSNRLCIHHELKENPEILKEEIHRPLFITGMPRSGSTLLQRLLSTDPASRCLHFWEAVRPAPLRRARSQDPYPRIAEARKMLRYMHRMIPDYNTVHPMNPEYPEECFILFINTFASPEFGLFVQTPQYNDWAYRQDKIPVYHYYRKQLQLLQFRCRGERWVLKAPVHVGFLDALLAVFPDACIVHTHRDPLKVVPSTFSLIARLRGMYSDGIDLDSIGQRVVERSSNLLERGAQVRDTANPAQFYDVHYNNLMQDPIGTVRGIYEYFDYMFDDGLEEQMRQWLAKNPQGKHGRHRYSLEQFGLSREQVAKQFASYYQRYGMTPDSS